MAFFPDILIGAARLPLVAVGLPLGLGMLSGYPTAQVVKGPWYNNLKVPPGRPPRWVFPIVWPALYVSMGYASHLIVGALDNALTSTVRSQCQTALWLYYGQLALNLTWTPLFFGAKRTGLALVNSVLMAGTTFYLTNLVSGIAPTASQLLLPYCAWLTFATYLNAGIWWLNGSEKQKTQ